MIQVAGNWELSWNTPIKEAELWNLPLRDFGVTDWWMWPVSGIRQNEQSVTLHERHSIDDILHENEHLTWVFLEPGGDSLHEFNHPQDVMYVFGSAHHNPVARGLPRTGDKVITLPTINNDGVLWPHQVLVTLLYDRLVKSWQ